MNYEKIYNQLIEKRRKEAPEEDYIEIHHIIPRCMGGNNYKENKIKLTAREHYIAHALLCKIYPNVAGLWYAFHCMCHKILKGRQYKVSSRLFDMYKRHYSEIISQQMKGRIPWNKGINPWNEKQRKEISKRNSGPGNGMYGKKQSQKCKEIVGAIWRGKKIPDEIKFKNRKKGKDHPRYGKHWGPDFAYKSAISKCYKQILRYETNIIKKEDWDKYKLDKPVYNVSLTTINKHFGTFENMINVINKQYNTCFEVQ